MCSNCHAEVEAGVADLPGGPFRGSSTGRRARLLIERLWVRVPPPELTCPRRASRTTGPSLTRGGGGKLGEGAQLRAPACSPRESLCPCDARWPGIRRRARSRADPGRDYDVGSHPAASWSIHALATASASRSLVSVMEMLRSPHAATTTTRGAVVAVSVTTPPGTPPMRAVMQRPGALVSHGRRGRREASGFAGCLSPVRVGAPVWFGRFARLRIWKDLGETMSTARRKVTVASAARRRLRSPFAADRITPHKAVKQASAGEHDAQRPRQAARAS